MEEDDSTMRMKSLGVRKVTGLGKKEGAGKDMISLSLPILLWAPKG